ncbi:MAG: ABC transporter substrate-binding protein [Dehalococcoidia bacterium]|nr:ABC transporter substrate-binding protein [Dehalococcoidia bacterium]
MKKRRNLLALVGTVILLLGLLAPMMQCAPAAEEEMTPPPEEEVTPPSEEEVTPPTEEGEIKYGGRLNVGFTTPQDTLTMDMKLMWTNWGCLYLMLVYDNYALYGINPDTYSHIPSLVQSYEVSEDGKTWTLHLVENATWHDGVPFTAEDVAFTFEYLHDTPGWGGHNKDWEEVEIIDDYTVKAVNAVGLSTAYAPGWWRWDPVIPKHIFEPYKDDILSFRNEESIGTGAFKLKEFKTGEYMWLVANEDYWGQRPYVDEVVFRNYGTEETLLMALQSGEIDVFGGGGISPFSLEDVQANPDINVEMMPGLGEAYLAFNLHPDGPLQDKAVRHAIAYGIDRDRIIEMAYVGYAERIDSWCYPESPMHKPDLPQYEYNPDKANEILDGAGYLDTDGDGIRNDPTTGKNLVFNLATSSSSTDYVKTCTLINEMLPAIGIKTEFSAMDPDTYLDYLYNPVSDKLEIFVYVEDPSPDPWSDWVWQEDVGWDAGGEWWNPTYWSNPRFNELWVANSCAKTLEEKKAILYEMQELMAEELPRIFLARGEIITVYRTDKFEGWVNEIGGPVSWLNDWSILRAHLK